MDHWPTVQLFFSFAQVRCFWRCFCFRSGLVALFLKMSERGDSWCTDSSFSSLLVKLSQVCESAAWKYFQACSHPCCLSTFSYPISSFQSTFHLISFDKALCEQTPIWVMTLCGGCQWCLLNHCQVSSVPIIVVSKNKRYPFFEVIYWSSNVNIWIFWHTDFLLSWAVSSNHQN